MEYREIAAPPSSPIERIWFARGADGPAETILPDGRFELGARRVSMARLAHSCGVTIRALSCAFDRAFGLTPKTPARVTRQNRAHRCIAPARCPTHSLSSFCKTRRRSLPNVSACAD